MNRFIHTIAYIIVTLNISAQDTIKVYLDNNFQPVDKQKKASVARLAVKKNNHYIIEDQNINGSVINYGEFISIDPFVEDGLSRHYESGKPYSIGNYKRGYLTGKWIYYNDNKEDTVDYSPVEKYILYSKNACSFAELLNEDSLLSKEISQNIQQFINQNFHLPARARGTTDYLNCNLNFNTDSNGLITCPKVTNCTSVDIVFELLRITFLYRGSHKTPMTINISDPLRDQEPAFVFVEEPATFQGKSLDHFRQWVQKNLVYSEELMKSKIGPSISVQFAITSQGQIANIKVLKKADPIFEKEVIRIMMSSPKWEAAKNKGLSVKQQFVMPVYYDPGNKKETVHGSLELPL